MVPLRAVTMRLSLKLTVQSSHGPSGLDLGSQGPRAGLLTIDRWTDGSKDSIIMLAHDGSCFF